MLCEFIQAATGLICKRCGRTYKHSSKPPIWRKCLPSGAPGTKLRELLKELGLVETPGCGCTQKAVQMDRWGVPGCQEHRAEIVKWLKEAASKAGWAETIKAGGKLALQPWWSLADRYGSIVDEAIRRAEVSQPASSVQTHSPHQTPGSHEASAD